MHCQCGPDGPNFSEIIGAFNRYTGDSLNAALQKDKRRYDGLLSTSPQKRKDSQQQVWQKENYPEEITSDNFLAQKIDYIWDNPVRKGYVFNPEDWKWGSARQRIRELEKGHPEIMLYCEDWE